MNLKNTRGYRNNNPGNLRHGSKWQGLATTQTDTAFCQFKTIYYGVRALDKLILNYTRNGYNTISKIISRYAPSCENNTKAYIATVSSMVNQPADRVLCEPGEIADIKMLSLLVAAIIAVENGDRNNYHYWYCYAYVVYVEALI